MSDKEEPTEQPAADSQPEQNQDLNEETKDEPAQEKEP